VVIKANRNEHGHEREVAVSTGELLDGAPGAGWQCGDPNFGEHLGCFCGCGQESEEEVLRRDGTRTGRTGQYELGV
jgi:hypothetical protein